MAVQLPRGGGSRGGFALESLEARIVLAAAHDLAVVGMTYNPTAGYVPYAAELLWAEDRSVTGVITRAGESGPGTPGPTNFTDLIQGPAGSLVPFFEIEPFTTDPLGARFLDADGYPLGWVGGAQGAGATAKADIGAVIERSSTATIADLAGAWSFQITHIEGGGVYTRHGQASFNAAGGFFSIATGALGDPVWAGEGFEFDGAPDDGRFDIGLGSGDTAVMYLSADESTLLIADLDGRDGDTWMGIGLRQGFDLTDAQIAGSYRVGVLYEGQDLVDGGNMSDLDGGLPTLTARLDLDANGTFKLYTLADADRGDLGEVNASGSWSSASGIVTATDSRTGIDIVIKLSENGRSGMVSKFEQTSGLFERPMSVVTRVPTDPTDGLDTVFSAAIIDSDGRPLLFDLREESDEWSVVDFERYGLPDLAHWAEGELGANPEDIESFETSDGRLVAAITTDDGLIAVERDDAGFWRMRNLSTSLTGAENIVSTITVFEDRPGVSYAAGLTEEGDMVTYEYDPDAEDDDDRWSFTNISADHLAPQGEETPVFVGPIISYVTSWNGLNIAGLAADGSIQAVWSGNGGQQWHASDLSAITGAPAMTSGLTAYLTSWGGINIVGLDGDGKVLATWWVPSFGGVWEIADLTAVAGGPTLTGDSVTSFVAPWGALNIVGLDRFGDVQAYWWTPTTEQWQVANLTASIDDTEPRPETQLQSQANLTHGGELNILGADATSGDLIRLFFRVDDNEWVVQNVSEDALWV
ncbi:MAG: hypothetical protein IT431_16635 [Phycisphaerales bacterium]|nr:hypothetical protein [Phycisphaerales bacterium]